MPPSADSAADSRLGSLSEPFHPHVALCSRPGVPEAITCEMYELATERELEIIIISRLLLYTRLDSFRNPGRLHSAT